MGDIAEPRRADSDRLLNDLWETVVRRFPSGEINLGAAWRDLIDWRWTAAPPTREIRLPHGPEEPPRMRMEPYELKRTLLQLDASGALCRREHSVISYEPHPETKNVDLLNLLRNYL